MRDEDPTGTRVAGVGTRVAGVTGRQRSVGGSLAVTPADVHVWCADLDRPPWSSRRLEDTLSADERQRADTFAFSEGRRRFVHARGVLRTILARCAGGEPAALAFRYGARGKPELAAAAGDPPLRFSASRTGGLALYAVTRGRWVGIDVEALRPLPEVDDLVRWCCGERERTALRVLAQGPREEAFLRGWTAKEAYAKAVGEGLALGLERVEVAVAASHLGRPPRLRAVDGCAEAAAAWALHDVSPDRVHTGALVVEGHGWRLHRWPLLAEVGGQVLPRR